METGEPVPPAWTNQVSEVLIGTDDISKRIAELGTVLADNYINLNPIFVVVLKGSCMFAADLSRATPVAHELEFIRAKSYEGTGSTGEVQIQGLEAVNLKGRHVLIIEDIVDTGLTLMHLYERFQGLGAASVKCCSFLEKQTVRRKENVPSIDYVAFRIPDKFVIGYGLDFDQRFRHLPFLGEPRPTTHQSNLAGITLLELLSVKRGWPPLAMDRFFSVYKPQETAQKRRPNVEISDSHPKVNLVCNPHPHDSPTTE